MTYGYIRLIIIIFFVIIGYLQIIPRKKPKFAQEPKSEPDLPSICGIVGTQPRM